MVCTTHQTGLTVLGLLISNLLLCVDVVQAAPVSLNDHAMDEVTAGHATTESVKEAGGIIIGNSSSTTLHQTAGLDLSGEGQAAAKGLNVVNSAESAVANTINIWDGSTVAAGDSRAANRSEIEINQGNLVTQQQSNTATLSGYRRSEADQTKIINSSGNSSFKSNTVNVSDITNLSDETRVSWNESSSVVDTGIKFNVGDNFYFEGNLGQGVAVAGHAETTIDGGSADIAMAVGGGISVGGGIGSPDSVIDISAGIDTTVSLSMITQLELPKLELVIDGAGCAVVMGSCSTASQSEEVTEIKTDNSSLNIIENLQFGQSAFSESQTLTYRSPFELANAKAEYIVLDNSALELVSDVSLELSDSAQKEARGMNIVNAIGSNVANSSNIARTARFEGLGAKLRLNQFNTVHHGR